MRLQLRRWGDIEPIAAIAANLGTLLPGFDDGFPVAPLIVDAIACSHCPTTQRSPRPTPHAQAFQVGLNSALRPPLDQALKPAQAGMMLQFAPRRPIPWEGALTLRFVKPGLIWGRKHPAKP